MTLTAILVYIAVGAIVGVLAGLMGVGGGLIIVPVLVFSFSRQGFDPARLMHLALGTSMASIMFTSVSSFWAHHRRGAVAWDVVRRILLGTIVGTSLGAYLASELPNDYLKAFFSIFLCFVALQMIVDRKPLPSRELPGWLGMFAVGSGIGLVASLVGIGGGAILVPFMVWCNTPLHRAIGTSAAIGFPIAVSSALGYVLHGLGEATIPTLSLGYVYLPALVCIVSASVLTAPLGVRLAHRLPVRRLKRIFAVFLIIVGARMLVTW